MSLAEIELQAKDSLHSYRNKELFIFNFGRVCDVSLLLMTMPFHSVTSCAYSVFVVTDCSHIQHL